MRTYGLLLAAVGVCALAGAAYADYVMEPLAAPDLDSNQFTLDTLTVPPGGSFKLGIVLTSDAQDELTSAIFDLGLSDPTLTWNRYEWGGPFVTGAGDDFSDMRFGAPGDQVGPIPYFENFISAGYFGEGVLVELELQVPADFLEGHGGERQVEIILWPDTIAGDAGDIEAVGGIFTLVVPEPATIGLLAVGAVGLVLRRRRA
jgi:hypothetical protein